jgi:multiple sugar transport system substrate-binding protein
MSQYLSTAAPFTLKSLSQWRLVVGVAVACVALVFVGCNGGNDQANDDGTVTLEFWHISYHSENVMQPIIDEFEAANPGVKVNLRQLTWATADQQITIALAAGLPPDICELGNSMVPRFSYENVLLDITERSAHLRDEYIMWEPGMIDDRVYALPWGVGTRILFINDDLMKRAEIPPGTIPNTWSEMLEIAQKIDALGDDVYGMGLHAGDSLAPYQRVLPYIWGNGGSTLTFDLTEANISSNETVEALEFVKRLRPYSMIDQSREIDRAFGEGLIGMQISGPWLFRLLPSRYPNLRYSTGLVPKPDKRGGTHASTLGGQMLVVFKKTKHPELAYKLAEFVTSLEKTLPICRNQRNVLPAAKAGFDDPQFTDDPQLTAFMEQTRQARSFPPHPRWTAIERMMSRAVEEILLYDDVDVRELAQRYNRAINLKLSE